MIKIDINHTKCKTLRRRLIKEYHIKVNDLWLTGLFQYFMKENPNISDNDLFEQAFEQWKLADLKKAAIPCFPNGVKRKDPITLQGNMALQVQSVLDISIPAFDQWRCIHNKKTDEVVEQDEARSTTVPKKRMLQLELFDGFDTVNAIEYSPIPQLNTKLTPGIKVIVICPVLCLNKVIHLEAKNIKILGGELDTLIIPNAYENVLLKVLKRPMTANPITDYAEAVVIEAKSQIRNHQNTPSIPMNRKNTPVELSGVQILDDDDELLIGVDWNIIEQKQGSNLPYENGNKTATTSSNDKRLMSRTSGNFDESCDYINMLTSNEDDILNELLYQPSTSGTKAISQTEKNHYRNQSISNMFGDDDDDDALLLALNQMTPDEAQPSTSAQGGQKVNPNPLPKEPKKLINKVGTESEHFTHLNEFTLCGSMIVSISQLNSIIDSGKMSKTFILYAEIDSITEKIRWTKSNQLTLGVFLTDQSKALLQVRIASKVLCKLGNVKLSEMLRLRDAQSKSDVKEVEKLRGILFKVKEELEKLHCLMTISYDNEMHPILTKLHSDSYLSVWDGKVKILKNGKN